jgi:hypothetical protein
MEVVSFTPWPLSLPGSAPDSHWIEGWVGPRAMLNAVKCFVRACTERFRTVEWLYSKQAYMLNGMLNCSVFSVVSRVGRLWRTALHARGSTVTLCFLFVRGLTTILMVGGLGVEDQQNELHMISWGWGTEECLPIKTKNTKLTGITNLRRSYCCRPSGHQKERRYVRVFHGALNGAAWNLKRSKNCRSSRRSHDATLVISFAVARQMYMGFVFHVLLFRGTYSSLRS